MVTLAEYPHAYWAGLPKAWGNGRQGYKIKLSVVHYTAGSESRSSAENGAAYDKIRDDGTSCHCFHDPDSSAQEVRRADRANSAFTEGNRIGVHHELCGTAQTRAQWLDPASDQILWRAARASAHDCIDFGLQPRRLTVPEVRECWTRNATAIGGLCGHVDITRAFPGPGRTHDDPGSQFPWDIYEERVRLLMHQIQSPIVSVEEDEEMRNKWLAHCKWPKSGGGFEEFWVIVDDSQGLPTWVSVPNWPAHEDAVGIYGPEKNISDPTSFKVLCGTQNPNDVTLPVKKEVK